MIVLTIIALAFIVFTAVQIVLVNLPPIPRELLVVIARYIPYVRRGILFFNAFTHMEIVLPLALLTLTMHTVFVSYRLVLWVASKIPLLGVSSD